MSQLKATPGPWLVHSTNRLIVRASDAFGDASVKGNKVEADFIPLALLRDPADGFSEDETLANGFLIAAAPELYEALEKICDELAMRPRDDGPLVTAGRTVLAKARGESV